MAASIPSFLWPQRLAATARPSNHRASTIRAAADFQLAAVESPAPNLVPAITLSDKALSHLQKLRADQKKDLCLRVGVRQGGCSGMSYIMDFEDRGNVRSDDSVMEQEGFTMGKPGEFEFFRFVLANFFSACLPHSV
ncbi:iron-sulfur assembly protein IscA-like 2, mitochondrial [Selaginella moellendorffii]|uniref:iron-sulfur assembly protein IscA-like 2, mitochondrial n=1 Tax=Selaginella moellendorffii TaxID=88036 RepID=UPI000D1CB3F8|nr:iron-sulfur assembly protein IscA-like 2, mitochondrial [Selaginella moellendorffii]|eukprot:XP_024544308.1 iron-sulfur assembly protein IscA-like 2, mitochondrial [Selaginella moellendorffii]